jgi:hypothetical protein
MTLPKIYLFPDFCLRINASLSMGMARCQVSSHDMFLNCSLVSLLSAPVLPEFFLCWSRGIVNFYYIFFSKAKTKFKIYSGFYRKGIESPIDFCLGKTGRSCFWIFETSFSARLLSFSEILLYHRIQRARRFLSVRSSQLSGWRLCQDLRDISFKIHLIKYKRR